MRSCVSEEHWVGSSSLGASCCIWCICRWFGCCCCCCRHRTPCNALAAAAATQCPAMSSQLVLAPVLIGATVNTYFPTVVSQSEWPSEGHCTRCTLLSCGGNAVCLVCLLQSGRVLQLRKGAAQEGCCSSCLFSPGPACPFQRLLAALSFHRCPAAICGTTPLLALSVHHIKPHIPCVVSPWQPCTHPDRFKPLALAQNASHRL